MRMLPVLVLFLVSRSRELVRKLCAGQAFRSSTWKQDEKFRSISSCEERKRKKEQVRSNAAAHAWLQSLREPTVGKIYLRRSRTRNSMTKRWKKLRNAS